jgi:RNA polymerase sigma-70 factor (ECF subfamily)
MTGDPDADRYEEFLELFARHHERLFSYIYSLVPHHADAEDIFQQCSVILWRKFSQFAREGSFLSWACGIALYEIRNFWRAAGRDRMQYDADLISELAERRLESIDRNEDRRAALQRCLGRLKGPQRELILFAYSSDCSVKELADRTGRASQTLYNQLSQIRRKLFDCVQRTLSTQE